MTAVLTKRIQSDGFRKKIAILDEWMKEDLGNVTFHEVSTTLSLLIFPPSLINLHYGLAGTTTTARGHTNTTTSRS